MNGVQSRIAIEHIQVLKTLRDAGNITKQQMKSIRGQIITMRPKDREEYLKKIIKRSAYVKEGQKWNVAQYTKTKSGS